MTISSRRSNYYKLIFGFPVPVDDVLDWAQWFETADRVIKKENVGEAIVSTVFLGIDHGFGTGQPILFETMVFGGLYDGSQERYTTLDDAQAGHDAMVELVRSGRKE